MRYRVLTEVEYFIALSQARLPQFSTFPEGMELPLRSVYKEFTVADAELHQGEGGSDQS